jgi:competence protein ComEC
LKLPALAMTGSFALGIALGLWVPFSQATSSALFLRAGVAGVLVLLAISFLLLRREHVIAAALLSVCLWIALGVLSAGIAQQPPRSDFVLAVIRSQQIDLQTPLRWKVRLRDEPSSLPWGWGYDLDLEAVDYEGKTLSLSGGMRLSYSPQGEDGPVPEIHAGDTFWVLAQARLPRVYHDPGAFDRRTYLAQQDVDLVATLRAPDLITDIRRGRPAIGTRLARFRRRLREEVDSLFPNAPDQAGVLRAMLLGDRSFVDRGEAADFQKTGVFHVLVVAGLHVGAFAIFLYWLGRKLRFSAGRTALLTLAVLGAYVAVIEQRPPVLRAALMAAVVIAGGYFFRRLDLLNSAAIAALILLVANPMELRDSSFQLSFLAIGCIAGLGIPWLERTLQPYAKALRGWRDVTRDAAHPAKVAQFRIDLRSAAAWLTARSPRMLARSVDNSVAGILSFSFRIWELFLLTLTLQIGMLPMLASAFHRVTLSAPVVNLIAVPLTGLIVPLGFLALLCGLVAHPLGSLLALPLHWLTALLLYSVRYFARFSGWSYRIPGPPPWLTISFFAGAVLLVACLRGKTRLARLELSSAVCVLAATTAIAIYPFSPHLTPGALELNVLDVGQGDSLFLVSPRGHTLLIDGGGAFAGYAGQRNSSAPDPGEDAVSPYLWFRGFKRLDVVALTHAHQDHAGGLLAVLENFRVGTLWLGRRVSSPVMEKLEAEAHRLHIPIVYEKRGAPFAWDGVEMQFLWPEDVSDKSTATPQNDDSLVLHLRYGQTGILLPGDAEQDSERQMLADNAESALRANVLKIGHHGSKNSTTPDFLAEVRPSIGIISVGEDNPYGHPNPELLARLNNANVRILRTDINGAIRVATNGKILSISCYVACSEPAQSPWKGPLPEDEKNTQQQ